MSGTFSIHNKSAIILLDSGASYSLLVQNLVQKWAWIFATQKDHT
jgi:hypothetical protein